MGSAASSIPIFPPWCVTPPVEEECTLLGITMPCVALPVHDDLFGRQITLGHWVTAISLLVIGVINLSYGSFPFQRADTMKIITGFYAIGTGLFAFFRLYFGVGHFLLMAAAVHNLGEWSMLMMIAAFNSSQQKVELSIMYFTFYTLAMIGFIMMMPILLVAGIVEQLAGIMVDFALVFVSVYMFVANYRKPEVRSFFSYPVLALTVHLLFTILPLVLANFHTGYTSWYNSFFLETVIYISAPITHILLMVWSVKFDKKRSEPDSKDKTGQIPPEYRVHNIKIFLGIGFVCGLLTIVGIPLSLGTCPNVPSCVPSPEITGTSVAVVQPGFDLAFEDYIHSQQLEDKARAFKGNREYSLVKDLMHPHTYRFIERWESKAHLDAWIAEVGSKVFSQPALVNLLVGGHLQQLSGYSNLVPCSCHELTHGGVVVDVKSSCDRVWSVVSNWSDCTWVIGCSYAVVDPSTSTRTMHIQDGSTVDMVLRKLDEPARELVYEIVSPSSLAGFIGVIQLGDTGSAPDCKILYQFWLPKGPNAVNPDALYREFLNNRVPALQKLFSD